MTRSGKLVIRRPHARQTPTGAGATVAGRLFAPSSEPAPQGRASRSLERAPQGQAPLFGAEPRATSPEGHACSGA